MRWKAPRVFVEAKSSVPLSMLHHGFLFTLALSLTLHGCGPKSGDIVATEPHELLERSAAALRGVTAVAYDFEWGSSENPAGWVTGRTLMRQVSDVNDSWIRTSGTVHDQPAFGVEKLVFDYTLDGERAWAREGAEGLWQTASVENGANSLAMQGVFGYLPEFVEAQPFWKETRAAGNGRAPRARGRRW